MAVQSRRWVALLRAVNVGGSNKIAMADLRDFASRLGLADHTLLQSGNLLFADPERRPADELELFLEQQARERLGLATALILRSAAQWRALMAANPFVKYAEANPYLVMVMPMKGSPISRTELAALQGAIVGSERVESRRRELYIVYPDGAGRSKLTTSLIERKLGGRRGTARNWNTVTKIAGLLAR